MPSYRSEERPTAAGILAVAHALCTIVFLSWRFGGMEAHARILAAYLGAVAPLMTILAWLQAPFSLRTRFLRIALPLAAIAVLVLVSATNVNLRASSVPGEPMTAVDAAGPMRLLPSTANPRLTLSDFFLKAGLVLIGLNILLANPGRMLQRLLLAGIAVNAAVLACIGSMLKLQGVTRIFDAYRSPNENFFSSFVYYNHWGGFALLGVAAAAGLALYSYRRHHRGTRQDSPALFFGVLTLFILISLPMSGARASTAAGLILAVVLAPRLAPHRVSRWHYFRISALSVVIVFGIAVAFGFLFAKGPVKFMFEKSATQLAAQRTGGIGDSRFQVYRDTVRLFAQKPVFGWGWRSFQFAFPQVQSVRSKMQTEQRLPSVFVDAHNDWLQWLAELGLVGFGLAIASLVAIVRIAPPGYWLHSPSFELAAGLACLGLLAMVDFPIVCPAIVVTAATLLATAAGYAWRRENEALSSESRISPEDDSPLVEPRS